MLVKEGRPEMARCNCNAQVCGCRITDGENITITGSGTARDPWVITAAAGGGGGDSGWSAGDKKSTYRSDVPAGWLLCNGQAVSRTTYATLFAAIGTRFGSGDGVNTFNLPNETGRVEIGMGPGYPQDQTGGAASTTLTTAMMPPHTHSINHDHPAFNTGSGGVHTHKVAISNDEGTNNNTVRRGKANDTDSAGPIETTGAHTHSINVPSFAGSSGSTGGGASFTNLPPYRVNRILIKT